MRGENEISTNNYREGNMHYRKYCVRSPLFALRDPRLCAQVLAVFAGGPGRRLAPPPARKKPAEGQKG
jgi:hypothetical protein